MNGRKKNKRYTYILEFDEAKDDDDDVGDGVEGGDGDYLLRNAIIESSKLR